MTKSDAYAGIARSYDRVVGPLLRPVYRAVCATVHEGLETGDGGPVCRVLDMGCGTGALCRLLAQAGRADIPGTGRTDLRVTGLDGSAAMLCRAMAQASDRIGYVRGNAAQTGFKRASFDMVTICLALHENKSDVIGGMLREVRRVVKPGGRLIVADHARGSGFWGRVFTLAALPVERLAGIHHYKMYRRFMRGGGLAGCLVRHGFRVEQTYSLYGGTVAVIEAVW